MAEERHLLGEQVNEQPRSTTEGVHKARGWEAEPLQPVGMKLVLLALGLGLVASADGSHSTLQQRALNVVLEDFHSKPQVVFAFKEEAVMEVLETVSVLFQAWAGRVSFQAGAWEQGLEG